MISCILKISNYDKNKEEGKCMKVTYGIQDVLVKIIRLLAEAGMWLDGVLYKVLYFVEWKFPGGRPPLSFDHDIELMYMWNKGEIGWLERAEMNLFCIQKFEKPLVIELGCADGFYAFKFYSVVPDSKVIACGKDRKTIKRGAIKHNRDNITYKCLDFLHCMPHVEGVTNVIWDASINFFKRKEQEKILMEIKDMLSKRGGILSGCAVIEKGEAKWRYYDSLFYSTNEIEVLLKNFFLSVYVFESADKSGMIYFWATDGELPFSA